jgi:hypothetical protein
VFAENRYKCHFWGVDDYAAASLADRKVSRIYIANTCNLEVHVWEVLYFLETSYIISLGDA